MSDRVANAEIGPTVNAQNLSLREVFLLFLRAGMSFGAGSGIGTLLQEELVDKRKAISRSEFMSIYGIARVIPSGTMTAVAVAFGQRYQGLLGTITTLLAMILPSFTITIVLTVLYTQLVGNRFFDMVTAVLMPAALAIIIVSTYKLAQEFLSPSVEFGITVGAFVAVAFLGVSPQLLLVFGGLFGAIAIRTRSTGKGT
jgi:chromate transporter